MTACPDCRPGGCSQILNIKGNTERIHIVVSLSLLSQISSDEICQHEGDELQQVHQEEEEEWFCLSQEQFCGGGAGGQQQWPVTEKARIILKITEKCCFNIKCKIAFNLYTVVTLMFLCRLNNLELLVFPFLRTWWINFVSLKISLKPWSRYQSCIIDKHVKPKSIILSST